MAPRGQPPASTPSAHRSTPPSSPPVTAGVWSLRAPSCVLPRIQPAAHARATAHYRYSSSPPLPPPARPASPRCARHRRISLCIPPPAAVLLLSSVLCSRVAAHHHLSVVCHLQPSPRHRVRRCVARSSRDQPGLAKGGRASRSRPRSPGTAPAGAPTSTSRTASPSPTSWSAADRLASGLRRPLGCVWPEPAPDEHAGRLVLWVGDQDMSQGQARRRGRWPRPGTADLFRAGRRSAPTSAAGPVDPALMFANVLIGAMPRYGQDVRRCGCSLLAAALDPHARAARLRAQGHRRPGRRWRTVAHRYAVRRRRRRPASTAMAALRELLRRAETPRRTTIRRPAAGPVPGEQGHPGARRRKRARVCTRSCSPIDECQELFAHPELRQGGRASCATGDHQARPGARASSSSWPPSARTRSRLPTGVSRERRHPVLPAGDGPDRERHGARHVARTRTASGPPRSGRKDKGIGYLVGARRRPADRAVVLHRRPDRREPSPSGPGRCGRRPAPSPATRRRDDRPADATAGAIAAGRHRRRVRAGRGPKVWSETIVERLAELRPDRLQRQHTGAARRRAQALRASAPAQVWGTDPVTGESRNRRGYHREAVTTSWLATRKERNPNDDSA